MRPDISFSVNQISKFIHIPRATHLKAINKILWYLKGTSEKEIFKKNNNSNDDVSDCSDTNWA